MTITAWWVEGSYFEACNCEAVCPCRRQGDRPGGRSTYGTCDFALPWQIDRGRADAVTLDGLAVVLAGRYDDDEPASPWRVSLYVDERGDDSQQGALADIFLGRAGGTTVTNYAKAIGEVHCVRTARIQLDHSPGGQRVDVDDHITVRALEPVAVETPVTCGIPGHDRPGIEVVRETLRVDEPPLRWEVNGRCGFATGFAYRSDPRTC